MASQNPLKPVYPANYVQDYSRLLIKALRRWFNASVELIKQYIRSIRDSAMDDLFAQIRQLWAIEIDRLSTPISDLFRRLARTHLGWWAQALAFATGAESTVFLGMIAEPWEQEELDARKKTNLLALAAIGGTLGSAMENAVRNGLRSDISLSAISQALNTARGTAENKLIYLARNQVEEHQAVINQLRQQAAGADGYVWTETTSIHPRKHHLERVGRFFYWNRPPEDGHPGQAPNCKCGAQPAMSDFVYGFRVIRKN